MTYLTFIGELRKQLGDKAKPFSVSFEGDGTSTVFQLPENAYPVIDDATHQLYVNSVLQVDDTDYVFDEATGSFTMTIAPTNGVAVVMTGYSVRLTNADWLVLVNDVIRSLGKEFFREFIDTSMSATVGATTISLTSAQPYCIDVYEFERRASTSLDWTPMEYTSNWRYDNENNTLRVASLSTFTTADLLRVRGLKKYTLGATTAATLDVPDDMQQLVKLGCEEQYWRWRYKDVIESVSKTTTENTRTQLQEFVMLSDRARRLFEVDRARLKPKKPSRNIPKAIDGQGRP